MKNCYIVVVKDKPLTKTYEKYRHFQSVSVLSISTSWHFQQNERCRVDYTEVNQKSF